MFRIPILILLLINILHADLSGKVAITDIATVSSIHSVVANLLDTNVSWTLKKSKTLTSNLTIPKTQKFSIGNGVKLNAGGYTLTIKNGEEFCDSSFVGSGTIIFDTCATPYFRQRWIGSAALTVVFRGCAGDTVVFNKAKAQKGYFDSVYIAMVAIADSINAQTIVATTAGIGSAAITQATIDSITGLLKIGDSLHIGRPNATSGTAKKSLTFQPGGYAAPGAYLIGSNGDKIIFYRSATGSYDGTIGVGISNDLWIKSSNPTGAGSVNIYTDSTCAIPRFRVTKDSIKCNETVFADSGIVTTTLNSGNIISTGTVTATGFIGDSASLSHHLTVYEPGGGSGPDVTKVEITIDSSRFYNPTRIYNNFTVTPPYGDGIELTGDNGTNNRIRAYTTENSALFVESNADLTLASAYGSVKINNDKLFIGTDSVWHKGNLPFYYLNGNLTYSSPVVLGGDGNNSGVFIGTNQDGTYMTAVDPSILEFDIGSFDSSYARITKAQDATITGEADIHALDVGTNLDIGERTYHGLDVLKTNSTYNHGGAVNLTTYPNSYWEIAQDATNIWHFYNCPVGTVIYVRNIRGTATNIELITNEASSDRSIGPGVLWQMVCVATTGSVWSWHYQAFSN